MDDHVEDLIDNEREWRKLLFKKIEKIDTKLDAMHDEHSEFRTDLIQMKVWNRIFRAASGVIFSSLFGLLIWLLKGNIDQ